MIFHQLSNLFTDNENLPHAVAIRNGQAISFNQLRSDVKSFIAKYNNCRAALVCEDSYNFLVGFLGLAFGNSYLISTYKEHQNIAQILQDECNICIDDVAIENLAPCDATLPQIDPARLCVDFFTSGSTSTPKRISKSLAMFEREIAILDKILSNKPGDIYSTIPHCHVYGFVFKLLWPLASRHPFDTTTYIFLDDILHKLTHDCVIISSPVHLRRIAGIAPLPSNRCPAQILSAGSVLSFADSLIAKEILQQYPTEIFGSTETGTIAWRYINADNLPLLPIPSVEFQKGENGCLKINSPILGDYWYQTNDLIDLQDAGFNYRGRNDGVVKIEGKRISLAKVEEEIRKLEYIKDAAIYVHPDKPDSLNAAIVLEPSGQEKLSTLGNFKFTRLLRKDLSPTLERTSIPKLWRFIEAIPVNKMGKRQLDKLREL